MGLHCLSANTILSCYGRYAKGPITHLVYVIPDPFKIPRKNSSCTAELEMQTLMSWKYLEFGMTISFNRPHVKVDFHIKGQYILN